MRISPDFIKRIGTMLRLSPFPTAVVLFLVAFAGVPRVAAQDVQVLSRTVTVTSDPPGATIWKKEGATLICLNALTPGTVELKFHGVNDLQKVRLRKFGYKGRNLEVKPTDDKVNAALGDPAPGSFVVPDGAKPELKQLNDGLSKEFQKTIFADPEALRCAPFELSLVQVVNDEGDLTLGVAITLDRSFGGSAFRVASHVSNRDERRQKMAQITLENGIADLLARIHRIAAKFPDLKVITILCSYPTTEAYLATMTTTPVFYAHTTQNTTYSMGADGMFHQSGTVFHTQQGWRGGGEYTEVKDRDVERVIKFVVPAAQIPDTTDKKIVTDAVLAVGKIGLAESSDSTRPAP